jgi:uncharacterized protein
MAPETILDITVSPKSSRNTITVDENNAVRVYLTAPPVDGKANAGLIHLFSKSLKIPRSSMEIISGGKSKKKRILITGMSLEDILNKIKKL